MKVLQWIRINHMPLPWIQEMECLKFSTKGKSAKAKVLKMAAAESCYETWRYRNEKVFEDKKPENIWRKVCFNVVVLCSRVPVLNSFGKPLDNMVQVLGVVRVVLYAFSLRVRNIMTL